MKIAYLVSQFPAINHGYLLREIAELRRLGFQIVTSSVKPPDRPHHQLTNEERAAADESFCIRRVSLPAWISAHVQTFLRQPSSWFAGLALALRLSRFIPRDVVRQLLYFSEAVVFGVWARKNNVEHVHISFCGNMGVLCSRVFPRLQMSAGVYGYGELADPRAIPIAELVGAVKFLRHVSWHGRSSAMLATRRELWGRQECIPLGVDPGMFQPRPFRPNPDPFTITYVGRLSREKGQSILLLAVAHLVRQGKRLRLILVGDGPDRQVLEAYARELGISDSVQFAGRIDDAALRACYEHTDAFVLTSFFEGIPIVLMEAMALTIPCVAPWLNGIPELIDTGVDGLLFPPGNHLKVAECLATLMEDAGLRSRLGDNGRARILREYDINANTATLAALFRQYFGEVCDTDQGKGVVRQS